MITKLPINGNPRIFFWWGLLAWFGTFPIIVLQTLFALHFKSFTSSILLALILSLASFVLMIINTSILNIYPYSQIMIGMHARNYLSFTLGKSAQFIIVIILVSMLGTYLNSHILKRNGYN